MINADQQKRVDELCKRIANEKDLSKIAGIARELHELLEAKAGRAVHEECYVLGPGAQASLPTKNTLARMLRLERDGALTEAQFLLWAAFGWQSKHNHA
jgi:hypothetical protein